jgi:hypothetical protein
MGAAMVGYEVVGSDDHKVGKVAAIEGDLLIVEGGLLHKTKHAIPKTFAHPDDNEQVVTLMREGKSDAGVRGPPMIPPDSHDPL